ncbi:hypothetical protein D3C87_1609710 [compost metagenome]
MEVMEEHRNSAPTEGPSGSSSRRGTEPTACMWASPPEKTTLVSFRSEIVWTSLRRDAG